MKKCQSALLPVIAMMGLVLLTMGGPPAHAAGGHTARQTGGTLTIFAAASLKDAFTAIAAQFAAQQGTHIRFNFAGSQELVTQLEQGAPADVFASASMQQMKAAQDNGVIASHPTVFARNRLVVIVPAANPGHVMTLADLGRPGVRVVLGAQGVPVGAYARAAVAAMARDRAFGADFTRRVEANIVSNETNDRAVVSKVVLGEADAAIVYVTDMTPKTAPQVRTIAIPAPFNQIAVYPIAVVAGSHASFLAQTFVNAVLSPAGQQVLKQNGFLAAHG